jgi:predicted RNA binding protein YcfA (HicA-like mRNA interferase family)
MNPSFTAYKMLHGVLYSDPATELRGIADSEPTIITDGSVFVFVKRGAVWHNNDVRLRAGMYGCLPHGMLRAEEGTQAIAIRSRAYQGMAMYGGPVERVGRLRYIDGCTDSLLVPPVKKGDPCLNLLHFPRGIDQTMHTHPSVRLGMVHRGHGWCITPWGNVELTEGMIFAIHPSNGRDVDGHPVGSHKFRTDESEMTVIAFHPDSDVGPTDELHPMLSRTIVDGVPATQLPNLWTR